MKTLSVLVLASAIVVSTPATAAQRSNSSYVNPPARTESLQPIFIPGGRECLINKSTRKKECRSRAQWRKIAAQLADKDLAVRQD